MEVNGYQNKILKVASILMLIFSVLSIFAACLQTSNAKATFSDDYMTQRAIEQALEENDIEDMFSVDDMVGIMSGLVYGILVVNILFNVLRLVAAGLGIPRSNNLSQSGYFKVWGIILLVFGAIGWLFSGTFFSLLGWCEAVAGIAAPIMFIVGASKSKRMYLALQSGQYAPGYAAGYQQPGYQQPGYQQPGYPQQNQSYGQQQPGYPQQNQSYGQPPVSPQQPQYGQPPASPPPQSYGQQPVNPPQGEAQPYWQPSPPQSYQQPGQTDGKDDPYRPN